MHMAPAITNTLPDMYNIDSKFFRLILILVNHHTYIQPCQTGRGR